MNQKEKYYAGVAARAIREISSSVESWTSFLTTMGKNYDFNYPDQVMIHAQRPNATLCMEFDQWKEEKYRYVKRGSKGIALFVTDSERPYLRYVFDVADTGSRRNSRELEKLWKFDDSHRIPIQEAMEKAFGAKKEWNMEMQLQNVAEKLAEEYFSDRRNEMADIVAESFLEGYDELNLEVAFTRAVSTSVAYSLYSRLTDNAEVYFDEEDFRNIFEFNTRKSVNALGTAVSTISTEMFLEIEKTVIAFEQQKEVERSERYDDTDELQQSWGIFDSGDSVTEYRSEAIREVRTNEESVPQGEQTDDLQRHDFDGNTVSTPLGSGRNSEQENGSADEPVIGEESGTEQEREPDVLGAAYERTKGTSRRSDYDGVNQQLTLDLFLSEQEQIRWIDEAESVETNATFAFSFAPEDIDTILIHGSNTDNARMMVATEFMKQKSAGEIAERLKTIYRGGYGLKTSRGAVSAWYGEDGIHLAKGKTARYSNTKIITWNEVAERIGELLENGQFATNVELVEAASFEKTQIAQRLWYLIHDFSDESKELHLFPSLSEIKGYGFPSETQSLAERLNDLSFCNQIAAEYEDFIDKYEADRSILRFHYHRVYELHKSVKELFFDRRAYETEIFDLPESKPFICLLYTSPSPRDRG